MKKLFIFIKYLFSSISSFLVDIGFFTLIFNITKIDILASIIARIISSIYNFIINRNIVFKSNNDKKKSFIMYVILVIIQMISSATLVHIFSLLIDIHPSYIKIVVDSIIFFINYFIQKYYIFK